MFLLLSIVAFLSHVPNSLASAGRNGKLQSGLFFLQFCTVFILLPLTGSNNIISHDSPS